MQTAAFHVFDAGENTQKFKAWTPFNSIQLRFLQFNTSEEKYVRHKI